MISIREDLHNQFINDNSNVTFKELEESYNNMLEFVGSGSMRRAGQVAMVMARCMRVHRTHDDVTDLRVAQDFINKHDIHAVAAAITAEDVDCRVTIREASDAFFINILLSDDQWKRWLDSHDVKSADYSVYVGTNVKI